MTNQQPITPPPELVQQWLEKARREIGTIVYNPVETFNYGAAQAAQWGADQELEACCEWLEKHVLGPNSLGRLRAARRPKPPTLKEQALEALGADGYSMLAGKRLEPVQLKIIRRALEALPND
jgi:hypothetical protein